MNNDFILIWVSADFTKSSLFDYEVSQQNDVSRGIFILAYKTSSIVKNDLFITILGKQFYIDKCLDVREDNDLVLSKHTTNNPNLSECYKVVLTKDGNIIPCTLTLKNKNIHIFYKVDTTVKDNIDLINSIELSKDDIIWNNYNN